MYVGFGDSILAKTRTKNIGKLQISICKQLLRVTKTTNNIKVLAELEILCLETNIEQIGHLA